MFLFLIIDTVVIGYDLFNNDAVGRSVADDMVDTGDEKVFLCRHSEQGKIEHKAAVKMRVVVDHGEHLLRQPTSTGTYAAPSESTARQAASCHLDLGSAITTRSPFSVPFSFKAAAILQICS